MASIINADNGVVSGVSGLKYSADSSGVLVLQTNGTTALTVDTSQNVTFAGTVSFASGSFTNLAYTGTLTGGTGVVNLGSGQFYKDASGNVGIGTSLPNSSLDVASAAGSPILSLTATGAYRYQLITDRSTSTFRVRDQSAGSLDRLVIDSSGNVGVGTTSPSSTAKLTIRDATYGLYRAENTVGGFATFGITANATSIGVINSTNGFSFRIGNTEQCYLDGSGNLLIGINSTGGLANGGVIAYGNAFGTGQSLLDIAHISGTGSGTPYQRYYYAGTQIGSITQTGTTAVLYNTTSDYRLKNNVTPIQNALATVEALNPVSFTWVDGRKDDGFIAHEIQAVIPNCVTGEKDAVNEDGTPNYQQMDSSGVIPFLVKAIQEQQAMIEELKAEVAALKAK